MARTTVLLATLAATVSALATAGAARAERMATPRHPILLDSSRAGSPYQVQLIDEYGRQLPTYQRGSRYYVLGQASTRYSVRIFNPTPHRVEAVVSIDGLDVIDGKSADLRKRGYVVPAFDSVTVDGFRTSTSEVATFRFSSVARSYAGRKGQARNVGIIGVAIFEEKEAPAMIQPRQPYPHPIAPYYRRTVPGVRGEDGATGGHGRAPRGAPRSEAPTRESAPAPSAESRAAMGGSAAPTAKGALRDLGRCYSCQEPDVASRRPGLGTEFGERRYSSVTWTRFQRKSNHPDAMATLRYNDAPGLAAAGIYIANEWTNDVALRETADPFPGTFATAP